MAESTELITNLLEVGTIYHSLLFSYQRALKFHMGSRASIYVNPAIDHLLKIDKEGGLKLDKSKTFEEAVSAFTDFVVRSKMVKNCSLENVDEDKYAFRVEGAFGQAKVTQGKLASKMLHALMRWLRWLCIRSIRVLFLMRMTQNTSPMELKHDWSLLHIKPI